MNWLHKCTGVAKKNKRNYRAGKKREKREGILGEFSQRLSTNTKIGDRRLLRSTEPSVILKREDHRAALLPGVYL